MQTTKDTAAAIMSEQIDSMKRKPPQNPIIGQKRADEWDRKIDGIIVDLDVLENSNRGIRETLLVLEVNQDVQTAAIQAAVRWNTIRDIIALLLLVAILFCVGYNTMEFWDWQ